MSVVYVYISLVKVYNKLQMRGKHTMAAPRMRLYGMRQDKVAKMENVGVGRRRLRYATHTKLPTYFTFEQLIVAKFFVHLLPKPQVEP